MLLLVLYSVVCGFRHWSSPQRCKDGCTKCTSHDVCTECGPLHFLTPDHKCSKTCPDGFYPDGDPSSIGGVCTKCVSPCTLCKSAEAGVDRRDPNMSRGPPF